MSKLRPMCGVLVALVLLVACSSKKDASSSSTIASRQTPDAAKPVSGGSVVYALQAEDAGGLCLPEAQLDINGISYARALYDTLTMPNDKGDFVPYLAKSLDHNADFTVW